MNIYNVNVLTEINQKYEDFDNNIINLIKYRIEKKLTTNFIFKAVSSQTKFKTLIDEMSQSNIKKFYSNFSENYELSIDTSVYKIEKLNFIKETSKDKKEIKNTSEDIKQVKTRKKNNTYKDELNVLGLDINNKTVVGI